MTSNKDKNKKANEILYAFSIIGIIPVSYTHLTLPTNSLV